MTDLRTAPRVTLLAGTTLLALAGCSLFESDPPYLDTRAAREARGVISPATPSDDELDPRAEHGPSDDREESDLTSLDGEDDLGEVVVRLGAGRYLLDAGVLLATGGPVVIEGRGPHRTLLVLDTGSFTSLRIRGAPRVELRGLTVSALRGGGIFVERCPDVRVAEVHFAGVRSGLTLEASVARIESSVFAGCGKGLKLEEGATHVRECAFIDCWEGIAVEGGSLTLESCAFVTNHRVITGELDRSSRIVSCLFAGEEQDLAWAGRPGLAASSLAADRDVGDRLGAETNRRVHRVEDFPGNVELPPGFDVAGVHLALERARHRGAADPAARVRTVGREQAEVFARACQRALEAGDVPAARQAARIALRYLGDQPLAEAPESVVAIAELGR